MMDTGAGAATRGTERLGIRHILCPADFSEHSIRPLRQAAALGQQLGGEVTVLHVIDNRQSTFPTPPLRRGDGIDQPQRQATRREVARFVRREIEAEARSLPADLIVMGLGSQRRRHGGDDESIAEMLLSTAPCPILIPRGMSGFGSPRRAYRRIVCALDFGPDSARTLQLALGLAAEDQGRIILLHVIEACPQNADAGRSVEFAALKRLRQSVSEDARQRCEVGERLAAGSPDHEILRVAREEEADLVVLGAGGQAALGQCLTRVNARHLIRHAPCSVLIVRAQNRGLQWLNAFGKSDR